MSYIRDFASLTADDTALVGGKTAAIGELTSLRGAGVETPPGFAITAAAYRDGLNPKGHAAKRASQMRAVLLSDAVTNGELWGLKAALRRGDIPPSARRSRIAGP